MIFVVQSLEFVNFLQINPLDAQGCLFWNQNWTNSGQLTCFTCYLQTKVVLAQEAHKKQQWCFCII